MKILPIALLSALFLTHREKNNPPTTRKTPETLVETYDENEMDGAIAKAKESIGVFLEVLAKGDADSFSIKAPITDSNGTEHFWITDLTFEDGSFSGKIGNDPGIVENVKMGDPWTVGKEDISDWMYVRGEMIHGGFTIDPLLDSYPDDQAAELRSKLVR